MRTVLATLALASAPPHSRKPSRRCKRCPVEPPSALPTPPIPSARIAAGGNPTAAAGKAPAGSTSSSIGNSQMTQNPGPDPNTVIAPYPTSPKSEDKSFWDNLYARWAAIFTADSPAPVKTYTPGIARRNRERNQNRFRRD